MPLPFDPPLDPSADEGRRLLRDELDKVAYGQTKSLWQRFNEWLTDILSRAAGSNAGWIGKLLILLGILLVIAAIAFGISRLRRGGVRARRGEDEDAVFEEAGLPADEYRRRAAAASSRGDHAAALLDWFRAIVRSGEERALLPERPGGTAHELVRQLARVFPDDTDDLLRSGDSFDDVRYGDQRPSGDAAAAMRELDSRLQKRRPVHQDLDDDAASLTAPGRWAR